MSLRASYPFVYYGALFLGAVLVLALPALAEGDASPLQIIMDGRDEAQNSNLTEAGMSDLAQGTANVVMYVCGALAIALTAAGLWELYQAQDGGAQYMGGASPTKSSALWKLGIAGLVTIPAVIAAVLPYLLLGTE